MKLSRFVIALFSVLACPAFGGEKEALAQSQSPSVTQTFYVSGLECGSCAYMVQQSIREAKGVGDATVMQMIDSYAMVSFDPRLVTDHQIAQAVRETYPIHGRPYLATLKMQVPACAKNADNSRKLEALFGGWKQWVKLESADKAKGLFLIHFLPLAVDAKKAGPQGWSLGLLTQALKSPTGLGMEFSLEKEAP